ncbi:MAG: hypothetical protein WCO96_01290 [Actinomycetes bacterium]
MSGRRSQDKGKRAERGFATLGRSCGFDEARRAAQLQAHGGFGADVIGFPGLHVEVKNQENLNIWAALRQADEGRQPGELAVVAFTRNRHPFYIATLAEPFLQIYKGAYAPSDHS